MQHSEQKCVHFCSECCIVGYGTSGLWDVRISSIELSAIWDAPALMWRQCDIYRIRFSLAVSSKRLLTMVQMLRISASSGRVNGTRASSSVVGTVTATLLEQPTCENDKWNHFEHNIPISRNVYVSNIIGSHSGAIFAKSAWSDESCSVMGTVNGYC